MKTVVSWLLKDAANNPLNKLHPPIQPPQNRIFLALSYRCNSLIIFSHRFLFKLFKSLPWLTKKNVVYKIQKNDIFVVCVFVTRAKEFFHFVKLLLEVERNSI
jgi:hypothetical protein